jgi:UDP-glucose 4-epimerase
VRKLTELGYNVIVIDNLTCGLRENVPMGVELLKMNVGSPDIGEKLAGLDNGRIDAVFHLAAQIDVRKSVENPVFDARVNIMETLQFLGFCRDFGVKRFVFASSGGAIYGQPNAIPTPETDLENPINPYGVAKLAIEKYLHVFYLLHGLPYLALRLSNVYGPYQTSHGEAGVVAIFCRRLIAGENPVIYGNGSQTRDYVYVEDVVKAFLRALDRPDKTGCYNIGTQRETDVKALLRELTSISGDKVTPEYRNARKGEQMRSCLDYTKARKELDWKPDFTLHEGLSRTYRWFLNSHK